MSERKIAATYPPAVVRAQTRDDLSSTDDETAWPTTWHSTRIVVPSSWFAISSVAALGEPRSLRKQSPAPLAPHGMQVAAPAGPGGGPVVGCVVG